MPETNFFWDPLSDNILQERDAIGAVTAEYTTEPGLYGNVISQNRGGVESQFHFDALGSTLPVTDDNQNVTDTFAYTAFGEVTERTGTTEIPFQYIGQRGYYRDSLTGVYLVRRRAHGPTTARWLSVDPINCKWICNGYILVLNRPLLLYDPSGLFAMSCARAPVGVQHVPGRGAFAEVRVDSIVEGHPLYDPNILSTGFVARWVPDSRRFMAGDCCCCDEIGWVQVIKTTAKYSLSTGIILIGPGDFRNLFGETRGRWIVDGGIPYPAGSGNPDIPAAGNPCKMTGPIGMSDSPERPKTAVFSTLISWKGEFEACIFCISGKEAGAGSSAVESWNDNGVDVTRYVRNITVYDCVKWSASYTRRSDGQYDRDEPPPIAGGAPSANFEEALSYLFTVSFVPSV